MARRHRALAHEHDDDSLSDEIDDVSIDASIDAGGAGTAAKRPRRDHVPWVDKHRPRAVLEVSINPKKAREVRDVFVPMAQAKSACRLLVLSGPAGASKLTLAKCLAQETLGSADPYAPGHVEYLDSSLDAVSQAHHFRDFMDACRYLVGGHRRAVLIEDLPNVFHAETLASFRACLRDWVFTLPATELPPVVLCLTEVEMTGEHGLRGCYSIDNCVTAETVLGRELLDAGSACGHIHRVKFLPVAKTYVKKLLQKIMTSEHVLAARMRRMAEVLPVLCESGDIRALISTLEFVSGSSLALRAEGLMREAPITLFHAVGKVIHLSAKTRGESRDGEYSLDYEAVKSVVDSYHNPDLLHLALLENYHIYNGLQFDLTLAANIVDGLSLQDTFGSTGAVQDFAVRATRSELGKAPAKLGRTLPMKFPRQYKLVRQENKVRREIGDYVRYIGGLAVRFADVNLIDGHFVPRIMNASEFRRRHGPKPFRYNRIGGSFREIYADDNMPVMDDESEMCAGARDQFREDIQAAIQQEESGHAHLGTNEDSDSIEDSATDADLDDALNDTLDEHILQMTTQSDQHTKAQSVELTRVASPKEFSSEDEWLDDPELAVLVSQGRL